jgi:OmpA-OmpF porin, OOP family
MLRKLAMCSFIAAAFGAGAIHASDQYLTAGGQQVVRNGFGECWRTGAYTHAALYECGKELVLKEAPVLAKVPDEPLALEDECGGDVAEAEETPRQFIYSTELLFKFDSAELVEQGREMLDDLAKDIVAMDLGKVVATAHADRIGSDKYNERLAERRAEAVRVYLVSRGVPEDIIGIDSRGAREPLSGDYCESLGEQTRHNRAMVECLQMDRRVEIEVEGLPRTRTASTGR